MTATGAAVSSAFIFIFIFSFLPTTRRGPAPPAQRRIKAQLKPESKPPPFFTPRQKQAPSFKKVV